MSASASGAIRGAALREFVVWYGGQHGRVGIGRALSRLPRSDQLHFDPADRGLGIAPSRWYPAPVVHRMLDGLIEGMDERQRLRLARDGAQHTLDASLEGFVAVMFRAFVSPRLCALFGQQLWNAFFSNGEVSIRSEGRRCHRMEVRKWSGHHPFLCVLNNAAGVAIYRATGAHAASTEHAACIDRGDDCCIYVTRW